MKRLVIALALLAGVTLAAADEWELDIGYMIHDDGPVSVYLEPKPPFKWAQGVRPVIAGLHWNPDKVTGCITRGSLFSECRPVTMTPDDEWQLGVGFVMTIPLTKKKAVDPTVWSSSSGGEPAPVEPWQAANGGGCCGDLELCISGVRAAWNSLERGDPETAKAQLEKVASFLGVELGQ